MISVKIASIIVGSGWVTLAQVAGEESVLNSVGGWGLACFGIFTLWRELKAERARSDTRHDDQIKFTSECTAVLKELKELNEKGCKKCHNDHEN